MIDRGPITTAVRAMLVTATGRPCGLGSLPLVDGRPASLPYTVLYPLGGSVSGAPFADTAEDAHLTYQVTVVAARVDQAEWLADRVRRAFLRRTPSGAWECELAIPGVDVWRRYLAADQAEVAPGSEVITFAQQYEFDVSELVTKPGVPS
ncbi:hypothetical protein ACIRUY_29775 [Streptomyces erythrochromogenes]|uniref:hypothetical protein n=1 Tax=Streptomyces erythrochromogenes TaxID=285574 RepID=UPI00343C4D71